MSGQRPGHVGAGGGSWPAGPPFYPLLWCFYLISIFVIVLHNWRGPDCFIMCLCSPCQASQREVQAMETMTAAFIHKFPRVTPELFVDLSQFIPFMSVSDIMSFPASLIVNDSVWVTVSWNCLQFYIAETSKPRLDSWILLLLRLTAIRDHSSGMKLLQKKAFVKRLLQSSAVGDVPTWPPYFLTSILPLLPYLPVSHFQQLTSKQVGRCLKCSNARNASGDHKSF